MSTGFGLGEGVPIVWKTKWDKVKKYNNGEIIFVFGCARTSSRAKCIFSRLAQVFVNEREDRIGR